MHARAPACRRMSRVPVNVMCLRVSQSSGSACCGDGGNSAQCVMKRTNDTPQQFASSGQKRQTNSPGSQVCSLHAHRLAVRVWVSFVCVCLSIPIFAHASIVVLRVSHLRICARGVRTCARVCVCKCVVHMRELALCSAYFIHRMCVHNVFYSIHFDIKRGTSSQLPASARSDVL